MLSSLYAQREKFPHTKRLHKDTWHTVCSLLDGHAAGEVSAVQHTGSRPPIQLTQHAHTVATGIQFGVLTSQWACGPGSPRKSRRSGMSGSRPTSYSDAARSQSDAHSAILVHALLTFQWARGPGSRRRSRGGTQCAGS